MSTREPDDGKCLAAQLDKDFSATNASMSASQRAALQEWQASDRGYEAVQDFLRKGCGTSEARALAKALGSAIKQGRLHRDVTVWRGIRSSMTTFGLDSSDLHRIVGEVRTFDDLMATSTARSIAVQQFTKPNREGGSVLMKLRVPTGTHAAWVAHLGAARMREQGELLLPDGLVLRFRGATVEDGTMTVEVEVVA